MSLLIIAYHLLLRAMDSLGGSVARWESTADTQPQLHPSLLRLSAIKSRRSVLIRYLQNAAQK